MNNKENFKNVFDKIHASEELKNKTFEKMKSKNKEKNKIVYMKYLAACAMIVAVFSVGMFYKGQNVNNVLNIKEETLANNELPRFKDINELKEVLAKNKSSYHGEVVEDFLTTDMIFATSESVTSFDTKGDASVSQNTGSNHSTTNTQVENVDEADIVKTDGKYIYYIANSEIYIVNAEDLKLVSKLETGNTTFYPKELYIYEDNIIVIGTGYYEIEKSSKYSYRRTQNITLAEVYNISNIEAPKLVRQVELDGNYKESRMIDENLYFVSQKNVSYYEGCKDIEILPYYCDSAISEDNVTIDVTDIAYFDNIQNNAYTFVAGFNVLKDEPINKEVILGASDTIYVSENNLYLTQDEYKSVFGLEKCSCSLYKFNLDDSKIKLQCKGNFDGYLNDQFSMDEYEGNLRIATTAGLSDYTNNKIYILNEKLEQIGLVQNLARGEKIYSVRFVGKVGYVVTFKQVDPLFVVDLSDPTNPIVKGELKIPGYSSYLHPYDETHIIGIGHNVEVSEYGNVTNTNMKMSMFDVSDLENPKEMFNVNIGDRRAYSEITSNHKALFYNKEENLIGFPLTSYGYDYNSINSFPIFEIDLDAGFEKYGEIKPESFEKYNQYNSRIQRAIYIDDVLYILYSDKIVSYDLETLEEIKCLDFH